MEFRWCSFETHDVYMGHIVIRCLFNYLNIDLYFLMIKPFKFFYVPLNVVFSNSLKLCGHSLQGKGEFLRH